MDDPERGSATVWMICILILVSAAAGWALLWAAAQSTRHSAERAADSAALAAATAALHRLATQVGPDPCAAAAQAARRAGAELKSCDCFPLDCKVTVKRGMTLFGALAANIPALRRLGPLQAASRAGPVGESGPVSSESDPVDESGSATESASVSESGPSGDAGTDLGAKANADAVDGSSTGGR
jgi:secretion/DNA translocation related TadE-like protein